MAQKQNGGTRGSRRGSRPGTRTSGRHGSRRVTTDHEEIRRWAEERGAIPSRVRGTGGGSDPGMIRLDFPGYSGAGSLEEIGWDNFFESFDDNGLALIYQETTAGGEPSNFNKLVSRDSVDAEGRGGNGGRSSANRGSGRGRRLSMGDPRSTNGDETEEEGSQDAGSRTGSRTTGSKRASRSSGSRGGARSAGSRATARGGSPRGRSAGTGSKSTGGSRSARSAGRSSERRQASSRGQSSASARRTSSRGGARGGRTSQSGGGRRRTGAGSRSSGRSRVTASRGS